MARADKMASGRREGKGGAAAAKGATAEAKGATAAVAARVARVPWREAKGGGGKSGKGATAKGERRDNKENQSKWENVAAKASGEESSSGRSGKGSSKGKGSTASRSAAGGGNAADSPKPKVQSPKSDNAADSLSQAKTVQQLEAELGMPKVPEKDEKEAGKKQACEAKGTYCEVKKHSDMGCAVVTFQSEQAREVVMKYVHATQKTGQQDEEGKEKRPEIKVQDCTLQMRPHFDKSQKLEVKTDVFIAWGRQAEKQHNLAPTAIAEAFDALFQEAQPVAAVAAAESGGGMPGMLATMPGMPGMLATMPGMAGAQAQPAQPQMMVPQPPQAPMLSLPQQQQAAAAAAAAFQSNQQQTQQPQQQQAWNLTCQALGLTDKAQQQQLAQQMMAMMQMQQMQAAAQAQAQAHFAAMQQAAAAQMAQAAQVAYAQQAAQQAVAQQAQYSQQVQQPAISPMEETPPPRGTGSSANELRADAPTFTFTPPQQEKTANMVSEYDQYAYSPDPLLERKAMAIVDPQTKHVIEVEAPSTPISEFEPRTAPGRKVLEIVDPKNGDKVNPLALNFTPPKTAKAFSIIDPNSGDSIKI